VECKHKSSRDHHAKPKRNAKGTFFRETEGEKWKMQRDHLLAIKWHDVRDVHLLSRAHDDRMVETPASRGAHQTTKPSAVMDYNKHKSDQMLPCYSFQRKSVKCWKKLFFHLFDLALVNAHILHQKKCTEKFRLPKLIEKVAEGLVSDVGLEVTEQSQILQVDLWTGIFCAQGSCYELQTD
jgi:hypothetical protein